MRWRILSHDTQKATLAELDDKWCLDQVFEAHDILDAIDNARARAAEKQRAAAEGARHG